MMDKDKVPILIKSLKESARTNHMTHEAYQLHDHYGQYWQHCPANSCTLAYIALAQIGYFRARDLEKRREIQTKMLERTRNESSIR